jgi:hypothetical protein
MTGAILRALRLQAVLLILAGSTLSGCRAAAVEGSPEPSPAISHEAPSPTPSAAEAPTVSTQPTSDPMAERYGFPAQIDPAARYLFYLHGKIVEDQGRHGVSPEFGEYAYEEILETLASYGFVVISKQRPKDTDAWAYAAKGARQISELINGDVPPGHITVVGASKGAAIATGISYLLGNPDVNYVLLGSCHPTLLEEWRQQGMTLSGNVLAIYDADDDEYSGSCQEMFARSEGKGLSRHEELVLEVGTGHGILYQPLPEWVIPTVQWARREG